MSEDKPIVTVGETIFVDLPEVEEEGSKSFITFDAEVIDIEKCKKMKHGSFYKYNLKLSNGSERSTRLAHLTWKLKPSSTDIIVDEEKKQKKEKKKEKKRKHDDSESNMIEESTDLNEINRIRINNQVTNPKNCNADAHANYQLVTSPITNKTYVLPPHNLILAPMVGGSELAFRILCRRFVYSFMLMNTYMYDNFYIYSNMYTYTYIYVFLQIWCNDSLHPNDELPPIRTRCRLSRR